MHIFKRFSVSLLLFSCTGFAYDIEQFQQHLDKQQYRKLQTLVKAAPQTPQQPELITFAAKAMLSLKQDEKLEPYLEEAIKLFPKQAELFFLAGMNQFNLAQSASIFSAPGHAKKGLAHFKQAAALDPENAKYQRGLIGFYLSAPGIVGGDEKEAQRLVELLLQKNPEQGTLAKAELLRKQKKTDEALALIKNATETHPENPVFLEHYATMLYNNKQPKEAFAVFQQALPLFKKEVDKYGTLYQLGRLAATEGQDLSVGKQALEQFLVYFQDSDNPFYPWAQLRLAKIQLALNEPSAAQQTLSPLQQQKLTDKKIQEELAALTKQLNGKSSNS